MRWLQPWGYASHLRGVRPKANDGTSNSRSQKSTESSGAKRANDVGKPPLVAER
jgi:hypothetical protein